MTIDPVLNRRNADVPEFRRFAAALALPKAKVDELDTLPTGQPLTLVLHPG
jgi:hypothetical protein